MEQNMASSSASDNNTINNDQIVSGLYNCMEIIASSVPCSETIVMSSNAVVDYIESTSPDEAVKNLLNAFQKEQTNEQFKQLAVLLLTNFYDSESWDSLSGELKQELKTSLLAGYWEQNDETTLRLLSEYIVKIYTEFGEMIYVNYETQQLFQEASMLMQSIDDTLNENKPQIQKKSLILFKAFVENLSLIDVATCDIYTHKLLPFLKMDGNAKVNEDLVFLSLKLFHSLFSNMFFVKKDQEKLNSAVRPVTNWLTLFLQQRKYEGVHICIQALMEAMENTDVNIYQLVSFDLPGSKFLEYIQNTRVPNDVRIGLIYLLTKSMENYSPVPGNNLQLIKTGFALLKEGLQMEGPNFVIAFEIKALSGTGILQSACKFIQQLAKYENNNSGIFDNFMKCIGDELNGSLIANAVACLSMGLIVKSKARIILEKQNSEFLDQLLKHAKSPNPIISSVANFGLMKACRYLAAGIYGQGHVVIPLLFSYYTKVLDYLAADRNANDWPFTLKHCQNAILTFINTEFMQNKLLDYVKEFCSKAKQSRSLKVKGHLLGLLNAFHIHGANVLQPNLDEMVAVTKEIAQNCIQTSDHGVKIREEDLLIKCLGLMETFVTYYGSSCSEDQMQYFVSTCALLFGIPIDNELSEVFDQLYKIVISIARFKGEMLTPIYLQQIVDHMLFNLQQGLTEEIAANQELMETENSSEDPNQQDLDQIGLGEGLKTDIQLIKDKVNICSRLIELQRATRFGFDLVEGKVMALAEVLKESSSPSIRLAALKARLNFAMFKLIIVDAPKRTGYTKTIGSYICSDLSQMLAKSLLTSEKYEDIIAHLNFIRYALKCNGAELIKQRQGIITCIITILRNLILEDRFYIDLKDLSNSPDIQNEDDFNRICALFDVMTKTAIHLGSILKSNEEFVMFFSEIMDGLIKKIENNNTCLWGKVFIFGFCADLIKVLGKTTEIFFAPLTDWFTKHVNESHCPLQQTCIYGLGELALVATSFEIISFVLGTLRFNNNLSIVDNLAGAFAKVAVKGRRGDPSAITKILDEIIERLPLKCQFVEYEGILACFSILLKEDTIKFMSYEFAKKIVQAMSHVIELKETLDHNDEEFNESNKTLKAGIYLMQLLHGHHRDLFYNALKLYISQESAIKILYTSGLSDEINLEPLTLN